MTMLLEVMRTLLKVKQICVAIFSVNTCEVNNLVGHAHKKPKH